LKVQSVEWHFYSYEAYDFLWHTKIHNSRLWCTKNIGYAVIMKIQF